MGFPGHRINFILYLTPIRKEYMVKGKFKPHFEG
jgi:hypothetical protein